jgi:hypothetical protein
MFALAPFFILMCRQVNDCRSSLREQTLREERITVLCAGAINILCPNNNIGMCCQHENRCDQALNINPEDLSAIPSVDQVVAVSCNYRQIDKGQLEKRVSIELEVVLLFALEGARETLEVKQAGVLNSEELERD